MQENEGTLDRVLRAIAGALLLSAIPLIDGNLRWLALIGLVPLATGLAGYCPLYTVFGINTGPTKGA